MSITYSLLLFFFLSLSLHSSDCAHLRAMESLHQKKLASSSTTSIKNDESLKSGSKGKKDSLEDRLKMGKINCTTSGKFACEEHDKTKELQDRKPKNYDVMNKHHDGSSQGSVESISWQVPRNKPGRKRLDFSSDYSPPKTHPPSHNR